MKLKGFDVSLARHIGFRESKEGDLDLDGNSMKGQGVAFVYIKDCRLYEKDGRQYYDASEAPAIPGSHGATYYMYGAIRKKVDGRPIQRDGKIYYEYWTCPVYFAHDGRVYAGTCKMFSPPGDLPIEIKSNQARNLIGILQEVLPHYQSTQSPETIIGRVQHVQHLIKVLQDKLEELEPKSYEVEQEGT